jgi:hypothetical protein
LKLVSLWNAAPDDALSSPARGDLSVTALHDGKWRVRDRRIPADDFTGLLGFIEEIEGEDTVFEVMTLRRGFEWSSYASFPEAIEGFLQPAPDANIL